MRKHSVNYNDLCTLTVQKKRTHGTLYHGRAAASLRLGLSASASSRKHVQSAELVGLRAGTPTARVELRYRQE